MDTNLTKADLEVLTEAMEMWENKDFLDVMLQSFGDAVLCKDDFEREERKNRRAGEEKQREGTRKVRRERAVLLRAKLILIRDKMDVESFA